MTSDLHSTLNAIDAAMGCQQCEGPLLRETLCVAQARIGASRYDQGRKTEHINRLQNLIRDIDRQRPLGPDGKHGDRHTLTCGCDQP